MPILRTLMLLLFVALPGQASAAVVKAKLHQGRVITTGPVTFKAATGERNRLTITDVNGEWVYRDAANPVTAKGDCVQVDAHTARCPSSEDSPTAKLGDGEDRVRSKLGFGSVSGGTGDDTFRGAGGSDEFSGGDGRDTLRGGKGDDELTGGPGRDTFVGGPGDDTLIDGETDAQAAPDVIDGGPSTDSGNADPGDTVDYHLRTESIDVDIATGATTLEDELHNFESVTAGSGADTLTGDADDNWLAGGAGKDVIDGAAGRDIPFGGAGADDVSGGAGDDVVWGDGGSDELSGDAGDDFVISADIGKAFGADSVGCGDGDDAIRSDPSDTTGPDCEEISTFSNGLQAGVVPVIATGTATFSMHCDPCSGTVSLHGTAGEDYGSAHFSLTGDKPSPVVVQLTPAGQAALAAKVVVVVDYVSDEESDLEEPGGYRIELGP